jgi:hypothetical protein
MVELSLLGIGHVDRLHSICLSYRDVRMVTFKKSSLKFYDR